MFVKSGLFLLVLTVIQVSARYKNVEPDFIENVIRSDSAAVSSSSSRIVAGWEAQPGQHPHHAALRFVDPVGDLRQCGGSIVSKEWIITSAYCTVNRVLAIVRAGGVSLTNPEYIFETTEWYNHPSFNNLSSSLQQHTISLVKMQRPVVYTKLVKAIRVQSSADAFRDYDRMHVYASGHGRTETELTSNVLRWVYLRAISNTACSRILNLVYTTTICAMYYYQTSQSSCSHDYGGPLVHVGNDGIPTLIGVTHFYSSASLACDIGYPIGYIRPGAYHPWFKEVTGIDFENIQEDDDNVDDTTTTIIPTDSTIITTNPTDSTIISTTGSGEQGPDENTTAPPEDSEDNEEDSESDEDDMVQLMKRLEVNVKVRVALNKYNVTSVGKEVII